MTLSADMELSEQGMDLDVWALIASKDGALVRVHVTAAPGHTIEGLHKFSAMFFNVQDHTLAELREQVHSVVGPEVELKKELHFDSNGCIHGMAGYSRTMVDPENWEARKEGEPWVSNYTLWSVDCKTIENIEPMSFRRRSSAPPLTHEELNG